jgi:hypothetical protein
MGATFSRQRAYSCKGFFAQGLCVAWRHGLVIVSDDHTGQLYMYSLTDGSLVRNIGGKGKGKGQFHFCAGGLCVTPDGDGVVVAEAHNNRLQQVQVADGLWVRFIGEDVLKQPEHVDCNADAIVVSEACHRISVFSWADGSMRAQFGSYGNRQGQLYGPCARLLADGDGVVVADCFNHRLCVFTLCGKFLAAVGSREQGLAQPYDVLQCASDGSLIVANFSSHKLVRLVKLGAYGVQRRDRRSKKASSSSGGIDCGLDRPTSLAALPSGDVVVRDCQGRRVSICRDRSRRLQWIGVCVSATQV